MTRPFLTLAEKAFFTLPTLQCALTSARLAVRSALPFSLGTMQRAAKVAVTERATLMARVQVAVPERAPDQPLKTERVVAAAVSVSTVPYLKVCAQAEPQLIPTVFEVTAPSPFPAFASVSVLFYSNLAGPLRSA